MDDTFVDVDALTWHLAAYDSTKPYYVGDMAIAYADQEERFRFAWGGAGWALSQTRGGINGKPPGLLRLSGGDDGLPCSNM